MTISENVHDDLFKRVEKMNLDECRIMIANMPVKATGTIDQTVMGMIRDRIKLLRQEGAGACE